MTWKRVFIAAGFVLALVAVAVYGYFDPAGLRHATSAIIVVFALAVVFGVALRLVKAKRGRKIRSALSPLADAAEAYQSLLLGRDTNSQSIEKAIAHDDTDRYSSGQ